MQEPNPISPMFDALFGLPLKQLPQRFGERTIGAGNDKEGHDRRLRNCFGVDYGLWTRGPWPQGALDLDNERDLLMAWRKRRYARNDGQLIRHLTQICVSPLDWPFLEIGQSPHEYQIALRLQQAKALLKSGLSLAPVAAEVGSCDQNHHLNRHSRKIVGLTPGQEPRLQ